MPLLPLLFPVLALAGPVPSVDQPVAGSQPHAADAAVVIGNEDYAYLQDVPWASRDAQAFRDWLVMSRGVPDPRVRLLVNASHAAMRGAIEAAAADVGPGGILWVYFAGHGAGSVGPDGATERALLGKSAEADANTLGEFVVRLSEIEELASRSRADQAILLVDACYANADRTGKALLPGRFIVPTYAAAPRTRVAVWTGAGASEVAEAYDAAQHGLFTYFALAGLQGQADGVGGFRDGQVTLEEAATWTAQAVQKIGDYRQTPSLVADTASSGTPLVATPPKVVPLQLDALPKARTGAGADSLKAELERLRKEQEMARADTLKAEADRAARTDAAKKALLLEASDAWPLVLAVAKEPGDAAELAVRKFLGAYEKASVTVDGQVLPVEVPQVADARRLLDDLTRPPETHPFPWLLASGGALAVVGGWLLAWGGIQERAFLDGDTEWAPADAHGRQGSINTLYGVGYGVLAAGLATGSLQLLEVSAGPGGLPFVTLRTRW